MRSTLGRCRSPSRMSFAQPFVLTNQPSVRQLDSGRRNGHAEKQKAGRIARVSAEAWFRAYIAAFNRGDSAAYASHVCDDVIREIADHTLLRGAEAIVDSHAGVTKRRAAIVPNIPPRPHP